MGGSIALDKSGRFYLHTPTGTMEMPLVAEGLRKLGMVARLIATGKLAENGYLFWDEPEANLNPKLIKHVAKTIMDLSFNGIQVFVATHSLFLLREFDILQRSGAYGDLTVKYIGLCSDSEGVAVSQSDDLEGVNCITALEEELAQADRYMDVE